MNMDRLTEYDYLAGIKTGDLKAGIDERKAFDRLAAYEDTGLEPEQIKQLAEDRRITIADEATAEYLDYLSLGDIADLTALAKARDDGRVVMLPCKVGEAIYIRDSQGNVLEMTADAVAIVDSDGDANLLDWFGKTVFLTRAEAEAALKGAVDHEAD